MILLDLRINIKKFFLLYSAVFMPMQYIIFNLTDSVSRGMLYSFYFLLPFFSVVKHRWKSIADLHMLASAVVLILSLVLIYFFRSLYFNVPYDHTLRITFVDAFSFLIGIVFIYNGKVLALSNDLRFYSKISISAILVVIIILNAFGLGFSNDDFSESSQGLYQSVGDMTVFYGLIYLTNTDSIYKKTTVFCLISYFLFSIGSRSSALLFAIIGMFIIYRMYAVIIFAIISLFIYLFQDIIYDVIYDNRIFTMFVYGSGDSSLEGRYEYAVRGFEDILNNLLFGLRGGEYLYFGERGTGIHSHFELVRQYGFVGAILISFSFIVILNPTLKLNYNIRAFSKMAPFLLYYFISILFVRSYISSYLNIYIGFIFASFFLVNRFKLN